MTKATSKTAQGPEMSFQVPQFEIAAFSSKLLAAYAQASQEYLESTVALNQEMMDFANERFRANAQVLQDLPRCTSWDKAVAVQSDFARSATDACLAEVPRLTEQTARTCTAMWASMFESAKSLPEAVTKT